MLPSSCAGMCAAAGNADAQLMGNGHLQNSVGESVPFDGAHTWVNAKGGAGLAFLTGKVILRVILLIFMAQ